MLSVFERGAWCWESGKYPVLIVLDSATCAVCELLMFFVVTRHLRVSATPTRLYGLVNMPVSSYGIHYFPPLETLHLARGIHVMLTCNSPRWW
jgi:hypothetical protein